MSMEREYTVIANTREDLPALEAEITASSGAGPIPNRTVDVANPRPGSKIQTHFMLTDAEAEALRSDPRVRAVEIPPDQRDDISIGLHATQQGKFYRGSGLDSAYVNWGLKRCIKETNEFVLNNARNTDAPGDYEYAIDGRGVDVVIQDSGIDPDHPEWNDYSGNSRLQQINWYTESGLPGTQSINHYRDLDGHGSHCASIAAGLLYGWAKGAHIYSQKLEGLETLSGSDGTGIPIADAFDAIRLWHNAKTNGRPTVVNMSWGYGATVTGDPSGGTYRGTAWTYGVDYTTRTALQAATGVSQNYFGGGTNHRIPVRVAAVDAEVEDMITDGIHVTIAAGNNLHKVDLPDGQSFVVDYANEIHDFTAVTAGNGGSVSQFRVDWDTGTDLATWNEFKNHMLSLPVGTQFTLTNLQFGSVPAIDAQFLTLELTSAFTEPQAGRISTNSPTVIATDADLNNSIYNSSSSQITGLPGLDYFNTVTFGGTTRNYHQGSSPYSLNAFMVGNIDSGAQTSTGTTDNTILLDQTSVSTTRGPGVNIYAPGTDIMAATSVDYDTGSYTTTGYPGNPSYPIMSIGGTSMAAPQVAGVVAQHLQVFPNLTPAQMQARIFADSKGVLFTTGSDTDYERIFDSLMGSPNRMLYSRYGKQAITTNTAGALEAISVT